MNNVCAGIVLFNPNIERLKDNLDSIAEQVEEIVLIDNASENLCEIKKLIGRYENCRIILNEENLGVAKALNQIMEFGFKNDYEWMLTLDQDSVAESDLIEEYVDFIAEYNKDSLVCVTCNVVDRNFSSTEKFDKNEKYKEVDYCITSGAMMKTAVIDIVGGFDERMFIDRVDTDICIRLIKHNYQIIKLNYNGILHEIGRGKQISLGFRTWDLYNHPAIRRYYMSRNSVYLNCKHHSSYSRKVMFGDFFHTFLVLLFEDNKLEKLRFSLKGYSDGFRQRMGKYR